MIHEMDIKSGQRVWQTLTIKLRWAINETRMYKTTSQINAPTARNLINVLIKILGLKSLKELI